MDFGMWLVSQVAFWHPEVGEGTPGVTWMMKVQNWDEKQPGELAGMNF